MLFHSKVGIILSDTHKPCLIRTLLSTLYDLHFLDPSTYAPWNCFEDRVSCKLALRVALRKCRVNIVVEESSG